MSLWDLDLGSWGPGTALSPYEAEFCGVPPSTHPGSGVAI